jgi:hypothetical protein
MQIRATFRRRANASEDAKNLNDRLLRCLSEVPGFWKNGKLPTAVHLDQGTGESAAANISPCLATGFDGAVSYASRLPMSIVDRAISDDFLTIRSSAASFELDWFCNQLFPKVVASFAPYRAALISDMDLYCDDHEAIYEQARMSSLDVDGRDTVFRFQWVNFFDVELCRRAFNLSVDEVSAKLQGVVKEARTVENGVLIIASDRPLIGTELEHTDNRIKVALSEGSGT